MKQRQLLTGRKWKNLFATAVALAVVLSTPASAIKIEKNETALNAHKMLTNMDEEELEKFGDGFSISESITSVTDLTEQEKYASEHGTLIQNNLFSASTQEGKSSALVIPYTGLFGKKYTEPVKALFNLGAPPEGNAVDAQHLLVDSSERLVMDWLTFTMNESKQLVMKYMEVRDGRRSYKEALLSETITMYNLTNAKIGALKVINPPAGFMLNLADDTIFRSITVDGDTLLSVNGAFQKLNLVRGAAYISSSGNGTLNATTIRTRAALGDNADVKQAYVVSEKYCLRGDNWGDTLVGPYIDPNDIEKDDDDDDDDDDVSVSKPTDLPSVVPPYSPPDTPSDLFPDLLPDIPDATPPMG